jgi:hypothetical protein
MLVTAQRDVNVLHAAMVVPAGIVLLVFGSLVNSGYELGYGDFALHPMLMCISFGVFGVMATLSYRIGEGLLGWSHDRAKTVHSLLHLLAIITGTLGVHSMWVTHADAPHFQSLHSWVGLLALLGYYLQFAGGVYFFFYSTDATAKAAFLPLHRFLGACLTMLCLGTIVTGVLSMVYRGAPTGSFSVDQVALHLAAILVIVEAVLIAAALGGLGQVPTGGATQVDVEQSRGLTSTDD